jgi:hypothetical protein
MAESLGRGSPIRLLEDAVRLLRRASPATLICHPIGAVPFALALFMAWAMVTESRTGDAAWARAALVPALALVWMNSWRAVYAGRLRAELSGAEAPRWTLGRATRMVAAQSFFGATKMLVLPLAALVLFPWAETISFYRYLAVLGGSEDLPPRRMMAQARHVATLDRRQGWAILPLLVFLQLAILINLMIALGILPQLVRILTGWETVYSRSGVFFVFNPLFVLLVWGVTWIAFDPFVQAVYTVRYFAAESIETGEDLRSGLRRLRLDRQAVAALILAALVLLAGGPCARADVAPADLQKAIEQAQQAPEYDWRLPPAPAAANTPWIVRITDRVIAASQRVIHAIGAALERFFRWLTDRLRNSLPAGPAGGAPNAGLNWIVAALVAIALAAAGMVAWQKWRARRPEKATAAAAGPIRLDAADLTPDLLPEESWMELADRSLADRNYRFALRALYLASLAWLGRQEFLTIHPGKTNHEYEIELRRRTHTVPDARMLFAANVAAFERAWYGLHEVSAVDAAEFRERAQALKRMLEPPREVAA